MQIGFVGLGKMGANMVHRLRRDGDHAVVAYDPNPDARASVEAFGAVWGSEAAGGPALGRATVSSEWRSSRSRASSSARSARRPSWETSTR